MAFKTNPRLLLVADHFFTLRTLEEQLRSFLPKEVSITLYNVSAGDSTVLSGQYFGVFSGEKVYQQFLDSGLSDYLEETLVGSRTITSHKLDKILFLPRDREILVVMESRTSAEEVISDLQRSGFNFYQFVPYSPDCDFSAKARPIAITADAMIHVPAGVENVYNIGAKIFDFSTIIQIMDSYHLLESNLQSYAKQYLDDLLIFARRISDAANEAGKTSKAVRTALCGPNCYAKYKFRDIIGQSPCISKVKSTAEKIAATDMSVLIEGDSGTGKSIFASAIHHASARQGAPFVSINFAALSDAQIETELFGCEEDGTIGLFQLAEGGSIFLDEIDEASLKVQAQILQIMQTGEIIKTGGKRHFPVDVRIIAATNCNLEEMTAEKTFRKDLFYRLKEGYLYLPPLSQHKEDIPLLVTHWMNTLFCINKEITPLAMEALMQREWQGNIRELFATIKFTLAVCESDTITPEDFPYDSASTAESGFHFASAEKTDDISKLILSAIREINQRSEIAGRSRIYWFLHDAGYGISEYKIRKSISMLAEQGLISATHGKYGMSLTDKGLMILESRK